MVWIVLLMMSVPCYVGLRYQHTLWMWVVNNGWILFIGGIGIAPYIDGPGALSVGVIMSTIGALMLPCWKFLKKEDRK